MESQIEAVKRCIGIMHEHGGFMLADVVGLGKTIIGTLIIKRFLSVPEDDGRERKVLVITPPAIQSGWKKAIAKFDKDSEEKISPYVDFITTGRIGNVADDEDWADEEDDSADTGEFDETLQDKNYGLIVIYESHKFRNSSTLMYQSLDELIQKIGSNTGVFPYVGLLSATPQNNRPNDLKNQIYLFERNHNESTLKKAESGNIERFFVEVNREYELLTNRNNDIPNEERQRCLIEISEKLRDCVLSDILERRTRTDVEKYYKDDIEAQGLVFPKIVGPNNLEYIMDDELAQLFYDTMRIIAPSEAEKLETNEWLKYFRYRAIEYFANPVNELKHTGRGNRGVNDVAKQLATIMQILLVKRLESSFFAFTQSLWNLRRYTENMIMMWENDTIFVCPQIDVNKELDYEEKTKKRGKQVSFFDCVEDIRAKIKKLTEEGKNEKGQNSEYCRKDFKDEYYIQLKEDYRLISNLYDRWAKNSQDPKFDTFKESIKPELFSPQKNTSGKLVIFSEAIDTVKSLARAVKAKGYKPLIITAANRDEMEHTIEQNFDANYEGEWKNDYNVIITTEVLAEGVNLHRANVILNYDTPWNSTRLMQRIGRVNRIGSKEPFVYVYNFWPSAEGDAQIQLVRKAHTKLQSFHVLFGEDSKIFSNEENIVHYDIAKAVDGEESPLQKYVYELKQYKQAHPDRYQQIEQAHDDWQMALSASGTAYFMVKAPHSARLAIRIREEDGIQNAQIISSIDLLEAMQVDEQAKRIPLPESWQKISAIKTYNQYFVRINKSRAGDKRTKALAIIVNPHDVDVLGELKADIEQKLIDVRICDPAIGSGAFPMGLLRELFFCRSAIDPNIVDNAADIKRHIIQNNIYGVDIERGAVDIARLRFWLSLIVDEKSPKALPNLDFKIMQGNSLLESYHGIDLSDLVLETHREKGFQLSIVYNEESTAKALFNKAISDFYSCKSHSKKEELRTKINTHLKMLLKAKCSNKDLVEEIEHLEAQNDKFFLWHTWFHDVFLRPSKEGFDIVIGNPPYIQLQNNGGELARLYERCGYSTFAGPGDIYCLFYERGWQLLKKNGHLCYITSNKWMRAGYGEKTRGFFANKTNPMLLIDFAGVKIFESATVDTNILLFSKSNNMHKTVCAVTNKQNKDSIKNLSNFLKVRNFTTPLFMRWPIRPVRWLIGK